MLGHKGAVYRGIRPIGLSTSSAVEGAQLFGWFKRKPAPPDASVKIASQPPGDVFPWPTGWQLTALDEVIIAVPAAILSDEETIGSVIHADEDVRINLPTVSHSTPDERIAIWLQPGQSVWLSKSCQAVVLPQFEGDKMSRRFRINEIGLRAEPSAAPDRDGE